MDDINHQKYALSAEINFNFSACRIRKLELAGRGKGGGRCWLGLRVSPLSVAPEVGAFFWGWRRMGWVGWCIAIRKGPPISARPPPPKKREEEGEKRMGGILAGMKFFFY